MPLELWICGLCKTENRRSHTCSKCGTSRRERHAAVHSSERAIVFRNPRTGEVRFPATTDQPMALQYQAAGFERVSIQHMTKFERDTGRVHEASNYDSNGHAERDLVGEAANPLPIKGLDG